MDARIARFKTALLSLDRIGALQVLNDAVVSMTPIECTESIVVPAMTEIGDGWENGEIALSQVYMSGRICEESVDSILPAASPDRSRQPKIAIAVLHDQHTLGKSIVLSILRSAGYELLDYGSGLTPSEIAKQVEEDDIEIILISTLMLNSALLVKELRKLLKDGTKIIVGGAPFRFDPHLWKEVGADGMGTQASEIVPILESVIKGEK